MHNQVWRPPYCYWAAGLIALVAALVWLVALLMPGGTGAGSVGQAGAATAPVRPPGTVPLVVPQAVPPKVEGGPPPVAKGGPPPVVEGGIPQVAEGSQPPAPVSADLVRHTAHPGRMVALTFDDGPHPEYTPQVLALLARYRAVATFCMIGSEARQHPALVRRVAEAGMRLCAHTVTHNRNLLHQPEPHIEAEIVHSRADIQAAAGSPVAVDYFRAPAGRWSDPMRQIAARHGMSSLAWSVDPRDWSKPGVAQIVAAVQHQVRPGAVILLHDGGGRRDQTVAALAELLPWLVAQGYRFDVPAHP